MNGPSELAGSSTGPRTEATTDFSSDFKAELRARANPRLDPESPAHSRPGSPADRSADAVKRGRNEGYTDATCNPCVRREVRLFTDKQLLVDHVASGRTSRNRTITAVDATVRGLGFICDEQMRVGSRFSARVGTGRRRVAALFAVRHCEPRPEGGFRGGAELVGLIGSRCVVHPDQMLLRLLCGSKAKNLPTPQ